mgnify:CR=1 FL=1
MVELIAFIILLIGFLGMAIIITRKAPTLADLPKISESTLKGLILQFKEKVRNSSTIKGFSSEILPQKVLSKIRVLSLKIDNKTSNLLQKLREKNKNKKVQEVEDGYWKEVNNLENKEPNFWKDIRESDKED